MSEETKLDQLDLVQEHEYADKESKDSTQKDDKTSTLRWIEAFSDCE